MRFHFSPYFFGCLSKWKVEELKKKGRKHEGNTVKSHYFKFKSLKIVNFNLITN